MPTELRGRLALADDLPRPLGSSEQAMQPLLDPQHHFPPARGHQGNITNALQGVPQALFGVQENAGAFQGSPFHWGWENLLRARRALSRCSNSPQPCDKLPSDKCKSPR